MSELTFPVSMPRGYHRAPAFQTVFEGARHLPLYPNTLCTFVYPAAKRLLAFS